MSTHKHFNKICVVAVVLALTITVIFMNGEVLGIEKAESVVQYEKRLFDTSFVHTIDIVMNDWSGFIENCENEEYETCSVVIDGEAFKNVAIRAKGNTSLSMVSSSDSERYSFKIEFDHYDSTNTYYGLDKLSLNNIIQDNTYMKDYLVYRMMDEFGVAAPLCSFVNITVNGEVWGVYLAVEAIEDSFLQRNYGNDHGELYKPDSMSFGGGRGNGKEFDMEAFLNTENSTNAENNSENTADSSEQSTSEAFNGEDRGNFTPNGERPQMPQNGEMPDMSQLPDMNGEMPDSSQIPDRNGKFDFSIDEETLRSAFKKFGIDESLLDGIDFENITMDTIQSVLSNIDEDKISELMQEITGGSFDKGAGDMGSSDVKLQYIDDSVNSYSNIFDNAKTDLTDSDKQRLIESLKRLSQKEDIENTVSIDEVIKYFVVHNYVCNGDSYTGSMIHNYYLYEDDGVLSMLPWDYNLSFGSFQSSDATSTVNSPIDTPVSGGATDDRPMIDWIFSSDEYTEKYHQYFSEFLETTDIVGLIEETYAMIAPYVEDDPSAFCSYEEFQKGVETLIKFCEKRSESIKGQLSGEIPSTTKGQSADNSKLIDASEITISDMGSMGRGGGNMGGGFARPGQSTQTPSENTESTDVTEETTVSENEILSEFNPQQGGEMPSMPDGATPPEMPDGAVPPAGAEMGGNNTSPGTQQMSPDFGQTENT